MQRKNAERAGDNIKFTLDTAVKGKWNIIEWKRNAFTQRLVLVHCELHMAASEMKCATILHNILISNLVFAHRKQYC